MLCTLVILTRLPCSARNWRKVALAWVDDQLDPFVIDTAHLCCVAWSFSVHPILAPDVPFEEQHLDNPWTHLILGLDGSTEFLIPVVAHLDSLTFLISCVRCRFGPLTFSLMILFPCWRAGILMAWSRLTGGFMTRLGVLLHLLALSSAEPVQLLPSRIQIVSAPFWTSRCFLFSTGMLLPVFCKSLRGDLA